MESNRKGSLLKFFSSGSASGSNPPTASASPASSPHLGPLFRSGSASSKGSNQSILSITSPTPLTAAQSFDEGIAGNLSELECIDLLEVDDLQAYIPVVQKFADRYMTWTVDDNPFTQHVKHHDIILKCMTNRVFTFAVDNVTKILCRPNDSLPTSDHVTIEVIKHYCILLRSPQNREALVQFQQRDISFPYYAAISRFCLALYGWLYTWTNADRSSAGRGSSAPKTVIFPDYVLSCLELVVDILDCLVQPGFFNSKVWPSTKQKKEWTKKSFYYDTTGENLDVVKAIATLLPSAITSLTKSLKIYMNSNFEAMIQRKLGLVQDLLIHLECYFMMVAPLMEGSEEILTNLSAYLPFWGENIDKSPPSCREILNNVSLLSFHIATHISIRLPKSDPLAAEVIVNNIAQFVRIDMLRHTNPNTRQSESDDHVLSPSTFLLSLQENATGEPMHLEFTRALSFLKYDSKDHILTVESSIISNILLTHIINYWALSLSFSLSKVTEQRETPETVISWENLPNLILIAAGIIRSLDLSQGVHDHESIYLRYPIPQLLWIRCMSTSLSACPENEIQDVLRLPTWSFLLSPHAMLLPYTMQDMSSQMSHFKEDILPLLLCIFEGGRIPIFEPLALRNGLSESNIIMHNQVQYGVSDFIILSCCHHVDTGVSPDVAWNVTLNGLVCFQNTPSLVCQFLGIVRRALSYKTLEPVQESRRHSALEALFGLVNKYFGDGSFVHPTQLEWMELVKTHLVATASMIITSVCRSKSQTKELIGWFDVILGHAFQQKTRAYFTNLLFGILINQAESDLQRRRDIYMRFCEYFAKAVEIQDAYLRTDSLHYLMQTVHKLIEMDRASKTWLCDGDIFLQMTNLLNSRHSKELCNDVLQTIMMLLAEDSYCKKKFVEKIGYDSLASLLLRAEGKSVSERTIATLLEIVSDVHPGSEAQESLLSNTDILPMILKLANKSEDPKILLKVLSFFCDHTDTREFSRSQLCSAGILDILIEMIPHLLPDHIAYEHFIKLISNLGSYSATVKQLKQLINLCRPLSDERRPPWSPFVVRILQHLSSKSQSRHLFDLHGSQVGIQLPVLEAFPGSNGFTFAAFLKIDSFKIKNSCRPTLFSFMSNNSDGFEAFFRGTKLCFEVTDTKKSVKSSYTFNHDFMARDLQLLCVQHETYMVPWVSDEVRLFINGNLVDKGPCKYVSFNEPLNNCFIGNRSFSLFEPRASNTEPTNYSINGKMGSIYIFKEIIPSALVKVIYELGSHYMGSFLPGEFELSPKLSKTLTETPLSNKLFLHYVSKATDGKMYYDLASPVSSDPLCGSRHAVCHGMNSAMDRPFSDMISCLGGVQVFLPLLWNINKPLAPYQSLDFDVYERMDHVVEVMRLILFMLIESKIHQDDMCTSGGFSAIGFILRCLPPNLITHQTVMCLRDLWTKLPEIDYSKELLSNIIFNMRLWIYCDVKVQQELISMWIDTLSEYPVQFRKLISVQYLLDIIRVFYWHNPDRYSFGLDPRTDRITKEVIGMRPKDTQIVQLRAMIIRRIVILCNESFNQLDAQSLLSSLTVNDPLHRADILDIICQIMEGRQGEALPSILCSINAHYILLHIAFISDIEVRMKALSTYAIIMSKHPAPAPIIQSQSALFLKCIEYIDFDDKVYTIVLRLITQKRKKPDGLSPKSTETLVDDESMIQSSQMFFALMLMLPKMTTVMRGKILQDFSLMLRLSPANRLVCIRDHYWLKPFLNEMLRVFNLEDVGSAEENQVVKKLTTQILTRLVYESMVVEKEGYQFLEVILVYIAIANYEMKCEGIAREVVRLILFEVITMLKSTATETSTIKLTQKNSEFQMNMGYFAMIVENFIYAGSFLGPSGSELEQHHLSMDYSPAGLWSRHLSCTFWQKPEHSLNRDSENRWTERWIASHLVGLLDVCFFECKEPFILSEEAAKFIHFSGLRCSLLILQEICIPSPIAYPDLAHYIDCIRRVSEFLKKKSDRIEENVPAYVVTSLFVSIGRAKEHNETNIPQFVSPLLQLMFRESSQLSKYLYNENESQLQKSISESEAVEGTKTLTIERLVSLLSDEMMLWSEEIQILANIIRSDLSTRNVPSLLRRTSISLANIRSVADNHQTRVASLRLKIEEFDKGFLLSGSESEKQSADFYFDIREYEEQRLHLWNVEQTEMNIHGMVRWQEIYRELTSERGCWGQQEKLPLNYWKLDKSEDTLKRRRRLRKYFDYKKHENLAIIPSQSANSPEKPPTNKPSRLTENLTGMHEDMRNRTGSAGHLSTEVKSEKDHRVAAGVVHRTFCQWISPMRAIDGVFELTREHILFIPRNADHTKDISFDELLVTDGFNRKIGKQGKVVRWKINTLLEIHPRRYMLRASALEFFTEGNTNFLMNFSTQTRQKVFDKIRSIKPKNLVDTELTFGFDRVLRSNLTERWVRREISNFEYLMQLNVISGRSYNDLMQYPVFPWVIRDYSSNFLDLEDEKIYRDLSKPIGALEEQRLRDFRERYHTFDDPVIPKFHYGSHYSSAGIVLTYLIRLEPFTTWFLELQGGRFDHADRMFWSVPRTWDNCMTSTSDVKELIPEFYYMPEFLINQNGTDFGLRQSGQRVDNVSLPPWASTPSEFIRINREALESEFVSQNLHSWIDLIFGYKQRGEEAIKADNVFYYLTYEGGVDIDSLEDPLLRKAYEDQIANFGQTPSQIFRSAHPKREPKSFVPRAFLLDNFTTNKNLIVANYTRPSVNTRLASAFPVVSIHEGIATDVMSSFTMDTIKSIIVIDSDRKLTNLKYTTITVNGFTSLLPDGKMPVTKDFGVPFNSNPANSNFYVMTSDSKYLISAGHWDDSIKVHSIDQMKVVRSLPVHRSVVTCLALGQNGSMVTGSKDCTVQLRNIKKIQTFNQSKAHDRAIHLFSGHSDVITSVAVDDALDLIVSASKDGTILIHRLHRGDHHRTIHHPNDKAFHLVAVSCHGLIVAYSRDDISIRLYSINAELLASVDAQERIRAWGITSDGRVLVTGGDSGLVSFYAMHNLGVILKVNVRSDIHCIHNTNDAVFVGCGDGNVHCISFPKTI